MKKWPIALQLYSVRDAVEEDFAGTMRKVKSMGYDGVEMAGLCGMESARACKKVLDDIGLELVAAHVGMDVLEDDAKLEDYAATGIRFLVIPWRVAPKNEKELAEAIAQIRNVGERCKARGMQLLYHNHDFEFAKINGEYILDSYYASIPSDYLQTELDTCWVNVGGENPAEYLLKYTGRSPVLHLKDFVGEKSENMYALIGNSEAEEKHEGEFNFRPVGYGKQDFPVILTAAESAGVHWMVVEQDSPSMDKSSLECAKMSVEYLKSIM